MPEENHDGGKLYRNTNDVRSILDGTSGTGILVTPGV